MVSTVQHAQPGDVGRVCANHPDQPAAAVCHRCGDFICNGCTVMGGDGALFCERCHDGADAERFQQMPWENPSTHGGALSAFFQTVKGTLMPWNGFFLTVDPHGGYGRAIWFIVIVYLLMGVGSAISTIGQLGVLPTVDDNVVWIIVGTAVASLFLTPLFGIVGQFVSAGFIHICGLPIDGTPKGYRATFRLAAYSTTPLLFMGALSALTGLFALTGPVGFAIASVVLNLFIWVIMLYYFVIWIFAIKDVHRVSAGRALGVIGIFLGANCVLTFAITGLMMLAMFGAIGAFAGAQ